MPHSNQDVRHLDRQYVFHSWSIQGQIDPLVIAGGQGCTLWDYDGQRYLDFSSQLVNTNIGHQHPAVIEAIRSQAAQLATIAPATANLARGEAAKRIIQLPPPAYDKVVNTIDPADANENAIRMARLYTGREKVLSAYRSYHGNTGSAIAATGDWRRLANEYGRGHVHFFTPYLYRSEFFATTAQEECTRALAHLRRIIECEGPHTIAALLLETIPGTAGIMVPPAGYLKGVRALADEFGIVMILDEVMTGFGRTGKWFAFQHDNVTPDLITFAKGVNSGYVPAGGVIISSPIADFFETRIFPGGLTYSGHPLAMAAIVATLDAMQADNIVDHAAHIGETVLTPGLADIAERHAIVGEARGRGVFHALELVTNRHTRSPMPSLTMGKLKNALLARGLLSFIAEHRLHVVPPCVITEEEAHAGLTIIDEVLGQYAHAT